MPVVESALFKIAGAAERDGPGVTEQLPLPLRRLDGEYGTCAVNAFAGDKLSVDEIESQCHEMGDFGHNARFAEVLGQFTWPIAGTIALMPANSVGL
jgi:hypothetical protein